MRRTFVLAVFLLFIPRPGLPYSITRDTVWSGDIRCTQSVTVTNGASLTIRPGTMVQLPTNAYIRVEPSPGKISRIQAIGTKAQPIIFTRIGHTNGRGRWGKIRIISSYRDNRFVNCQFWYGDGGAGSQLGLGVISSWDSRLLVEDSRFQWFLGDCVWAEEDSSATLRRCYFSTGGNEVPGTGGGNGVHGYNSDIEVDSCTFAYRSGAPDGVDVEGVANVWIHDSVFLGSDHDDGADVDCNGSIVERCWFFNYNGSAPGGATHCAAVSSDDGGYRFIRNNVFVNCRQAVMSKFRVNSWVTNCTFINCYSEIVTVDPNEVPITQVGFAKVRNCIMWGTRGHTVVVGTDSGTGEKSSVDIDYCDVFSTETLHAGDPRVTVGPHIFKANPLFVNPALTYTPDADYHVRSKAGRWDPKANRGAGAWVIDTVHSPAIDAGDPAYPCSLEPRPNGNRRNLGAYGGTPEASKSIPLYTVTVQISPANSGSVTRNPDKSAYYYRVPVLLRAVPAPGYVFDHWEGDADGSANPITVLTDTSKSVRAVFAVRLSASRWTLY